MTYFRHAVTALGLPLVLAAGAANAQTTVITGEPVQTETVITGAPIELTPVQRRTIYRTIVRERVRPVTPTVEYRVGTRVPRGVPLYAVPEPVAVEVPVVRPYKYMMVNDRVVLVDPATSEVVADVTD